MEKEKKPLLIRPSMAPRTNPERICVQSTMGASTWYLCVTSYVFWQSLFKISQTGHKNLAKVAQNLAKGVARLT